jgi:predicted nucleic acid-binding protein
MRWGATSTNTAISVISRIELLSFANLSTGEEAQIDKFLSECDVLPLSLDVEAAAIALRRRSSAKCRMQSWPQRL